VFVCVCERMEEQCVCMCVCVRERAEGRDDESTKKNE